MTINTQQINITKRGCGWPISGGVYAYVPSSFNGTPIWNFALDPTVQINDPEGFGLSAISMCLKSRGIKNNKGQEIFDIYDWIGESGYPNPLDWLFEIQQFGFHQKMDPRILTHLVPESLYFAVHAKASFEDPTVAYLTRKTPEGQPVCPSNWKGHLELEDENKIHLGTCPGLFFSNTIKGKQVGKDREVIREMPSFEYPAFSPTGSEGANIPAIFFKLPVGRIASFLVYSDEQSNTHESALKILEKLDEGLKRVTIVSLNGGPK